MPYVLDFADTDAASTHHAGGKGANLARMRRAGFPIPEGFLIGTEAYACHLAANGLERMLAQCCAAIDFAKPESVERVTSEIRAAIMAAPMPEAVRAAVLAAYRAHGTDCFVAVRSSGTAEDLAEASFAGLHDTFLDVRGEDALLASVTRCWASMWTPRAMAYRQRKGFAHEDERLAVVVLTMIAADAAGVMFTANPLSTAVDEIVINSAWGLGEGIVSGRVTPDEIVAARDTGEIKTRIAGAKAEKVVRNVAAGGGTRVVAVDAAHRARFSLTDAQVRELVVLGGRIQEQFDDWPQDVEWALADGRMYVLQARDITGVEWSWDEDVDAHGTLPRIRDDAVLSRARADTVWTGRITPLFYSLRSEARTMATPWMYGLWAGRRAAQEKWGCRGAAVGDLRWYKYQRGAVYFNSEVEYRCFLEVVPPRLRNRALCEWTPPSWLDDFAQRPGGWRGVIRVYARLQLLRPHFNARRVFASLHALIRANANGWGLHPPAIRALDDEALKAYVQTTIANQAIWVRDIANAFYLHSPFMSSCFLWMFEHWYTGSDRSLYADLITGLPVQTYTVKQNDMLWALAETIRQSPPLRALFDAHPGAAFFDEAGRRPEAAAFLAQYRSFLAEFGHRGQADRDIWYPRRIEDPGIDYRALALLLQVEGSKSTTHEHELVARREAASRTVEASIRRQPLGVLKVAAFRFVQRFMLDFYVFRDDSRHHTDRNTFAKKRAVQEVGRRVFERRLLVHADDFYYLSKDELVALLDGPPKSLRLVHAKVAARKRNCDRYRKEWLPPMYIKGNGTVWIDPTDVTAPLADSARMRGIGMSRGSISGRARVLTSLDQISELARGDILVARGTDPGWTPAFFVVAGLVLETGGTLSHGACLAREYGIPAVQLSDAMSRIADGARIEIDGEAGEVRIVASEPVPAPAEVPS